MSDFYSRVEAFLIERNLKRIDIVRATDIPESTIRGWGKGAIPSVEAAFRVAQFFGVTVEYLVTGKTPDESPGLFLSADEEEIIDIYRALDKRGKEELKQITKVLELCYNN